MATQPLQIRLSSRQRRALIKAAARAGLPLGTWLRQVGLLMADRPDLCDEPLDGFEHAHHLFVVTMSDGGSRHWVAAVEPEQARRIVAEEYAPRQPHEVVEVPTTYDGTAVRRVFLGEPRPHIITSHGRLPFRIGHRVAYVSTPDSPKKYDHKTGRIVGVAPGHFGEEYTVEFDDGERAQLPSGFLVIAPRSVVSWGPSAVPNHPGWEYAMWQQRSGGVVGVRPVGARGWTNVYDVCVEEWRFDSRHPTDQVRNEIVAAVRDLMER